MARILVDLKCNECQHVFEDFIVTGEEPAGEDPTPACERCGGTTKRLLSALQPHFKGQGFHCTDYGKYGRKKTGRKQL